MDVPFPLAWTWTRSFSVAQSPSARETTELLAEALRREGAHEVTTRDEALEFECPGILGMGRMALLAPISGGSIEIRSADQKLEIKYQFVRWVFLYAIPMMIGAAQFWAARKGFWFVAGGAELPVLWCILLVLQAMLGAGPYAFRQAR